MYGEMSHWPMLKATTRMPRVMKSRVLNSVRIMVKTSVDRPRIMARVPAMDKRSFQILIVSCTIYC